MFLCSDPFNVPSQAGDNGPCHPQTQGKIEHWHCSMKNQISLSNYYLPGKLPQHLLCFLNYPN